MPDGVFRGSLVAPVIARSFMVAMKGNRAEPQARKIDLYTHHYMLDMYNGAEPMQASLSPNHTIEEKTCTRKTIPTRSRGGESK